MPDPKSSDIDRKKCKLIINKYIYFHFFIECQCNTDGTIGGDTCDQTTGKCICKPEWLGVNCDSKGDNLFWHNLKK